MEKDITNKKFGRLSAVKSVGKKGGRCMWLFSCDCGKSKIIRKSHVIYGATSSCGCKHYRKGKDNHCYKHGLSRSNFYTRFSKIEDRCRNKNNKDYKNYGGRGIKCLWNNFQGFFEDMHESYLEYIKTNGKKGATLDRIDNNKNYCKENCRWIDIKSQQRNRRDNIRFSFGGKNLTIPEWSEILNIPTYHFYNKKKRNDISIEDQIKQYVDKHPIA